MRKQFHSPSMLVAIAAVVLAPAASARIAGLTYRSASLMTDPHMGTVIDVPCPTGLTAMGELTSTTGRPSAGGRGDGPTDPTVSAAWYRADRQPEGEPMWGPGRRRPSPARDLWRTGETREPHTTPRSIANVTPHAWGAGHTGLAPGPDSQPPADGERPWRYPLPDAEPRAAIPSQREVGGKRRRITSHRQRPDLRLINGEGDGTGRTRSGRLRPVPKENPS